MTRVRPTAAGLVLAGLFTLACPTLSDAGGPYAVTDIKIVNGKPPFDGGSGPNNRFFPGGQVQVQTTVRNDGIATPGETVKLWPQMEFVPGPGQTAPPIAFAGTALTPLAPDAGQSATYKLTFPAPSKEGIYKVRMNLKARRPPATILATA